MIETTILSNEVTRSSATITRSGTTLTMKRTCVYPMPEGGLAAIGSSSYIATPTSLRTLVWREATTIEVAYVRQ